MKKITIENIKRIRKLEFNLPETYGVYLLVGENGSGKTTLLTCIDRICNSRAFANGFQASKKNLTFDQYKNAAIQYDVENTSVRFRRGTKKWMPTPKTGASALLEQYGYSDSVFIKADSRRIDATQEEIAGGRTELVDDNLKVTLNRIFDTNRFEKLQRLKISHGRGTKSTYLFYMRDGGNKYSEKRFSTGELAIIRLVESVQNANDNAIILVDEAEMALHPRIQRRLVEYLKEIAQIKHHTVIMSTHSTILIRSTDKRHLMLLEEADDGGLVVTTPCYPAKAIGGVDCIEDSGFDCIFFVEDEMAKVYLDCLIKRLRREEEQYATFSYAIFPTGGYLETSIVAVETKSRIFNGLAVFAVVDKDAFEDLENKPQFKLLAESNPDTVKALDITPELWYCKMLESNQSLINRPIAEQYHCDIHRITQNDAYLACNSPKPRKKAKAEFDVIIKEIMRNGCISEEQATIGIIKILVDTKEMGALKNVVMPMINTVSYQRQS